MTFLQEISKRRSLGQKSLAVLIDPDSVTRISLIKLIKLSETAQVDFFFVGGSTVSVDQMDECISLLKELTTIPLIIFPGNTSQLHPQADAILFLSLISGRNPEYLIGKHVESIPFLRANKLEVVPTGYVLIDGGNRSSVSYISQTEPIPAEYTDMILNTVMAGQYLGMQMIYLEAGSGAKHHVPSETVRKVREEINIPLIVGGGIKTPSIAQSLCESGADLLVVGNILEKDPDLITDLSIAIHSKNINTNFL